MNKENVPEIFKFIFIIVCLFAGGIMGMLGLLGLMMVIISEKN